MWRNQQCLCQRCLRIVLPWKSVCTTLTCRSGSLAARLTELTATCWFVVANSYMLHLQTNRFCPNTTVCGRLVSNSVIWKRCFSGFFGSLAFAFVEKQKYWKHISTLFIPTPQKHVVSRTWHCRWLWAKCFRRSWVVPDSRKHALRWHLVRTAHCSVTVTVRTAVFWDKTPWSSALNIPEVFFPRLLSPTVLLTDDPSASKLQKCCDNCDERREKSQPRGTTGAGRRHFLRMDFTGIIIAKEVICRQSWSIYLCQSSSRGFLSLCIAPLWISLLLQSPPPAVLSSIFLSCQHVIPPLYSPAAHCPSAHSPFSIFFLSAIPSSLQFSPPSLSQIKSWVLIHHHHQQHCRHPPFIKGVLQPGRKQQQKWISTLSLSPIVEALFRRQFWASIHLH